MNELECGDIRNYISTYDLEIEFRNNDSQLFKNKTWNSILMRSLDKYLGSFMDSITIQANSRENKRVVLVLLSLECMYLISIIRNLMNK